jgi:hypothetical protein
MSHTADTDTKTDCPQSDPKQMSTLLDLRENPDRQDWRPDELRDMLLHQLRAPLSVSLGPLSAEVAHQLHIALPPLSPRLTLGEVFKLQDPPLQLLKLVKRFAKICRNTRENPLPSDLVMLLYYASISAALVRLDERITELPAPPLRRGITWLLAQAWLDADTRVLLQEGLEWLETQHSECQG